MNCSREWCNVSRLASEHDHDHDVVEGSIVGVLLTLLALWAAAGSLLIEVALIRFRQLRTVSNLLVGNLALSDLLLSLTVLPISILYDLLERWVLGRWCCFVWLVVDVLYCTTSTWSLAIIAFDRFTATLHPVWYREHNHGRRALVLICTSWLLSIIIIIPPMTGWLDLEMSYQFDPKTASYQCVLFSDQAYVIYSASGSFIIPLVIMCALYTKIFIALHSRSKSRKRSQSQSQSQSERDGAVGTQAKPKQKQKKKQKQKQKPKQKTSIALQIVAQCVQSPSSTATSSDVQNDRSCVPSYFGERTNPLFEQLRAIDDDDGDSLAANGTFNGNCNGNGNGVAPNVSVNVNVNVYENPALNLTPVVKRRKVTLDRNRTKTDVATQDSERLAHVRSRSYHRKETQATLRMLMIILIFVVTWMPFMFMYIISSFNNSLVINEHVQKTVIWLGYTSSAINPIIIFTYSQDFRLALKCIVSQGDLRSFVSQRSSAASLSSRLKSSRFSKSV